MVRVKILLVLVLGLSFLWLYIIPVKTAFPDQLDFHISNYTEETKYLTCDGPFFRTSSCKTVEPSTLDRRFYSAEINDFSPYGKWACILWQNASCFELFPLAIVFCVTPDCTPGQKVSITFRSDGKIDAGGCNGIGQFESCPSLSTNSVLGKRPQQSRPDRDTFSFEDAESDQVTLRLEEDESVGHIGEQANFKLRGPIGSASLDEFRTGELPLEITATIPESGEYEIVVDQKNIPNDLRYRGGYVITLDQSLDDVKEIVPSQDVE